MKNSCSIANFYRAAVAAYRSIDNVTQREKKHLLQELRHVRHLMPLLTKRRNKQVWAREDKQALHIHLRRVSDIIPYLIVLALPASFLLLPALAWWLDRRRNRPHITSPALPMTPELGAK
jgi:hypothetical protein